MPVLAGQHQSAALLAAQLLNLADGVGADGLLHRLPLPVQVAQLLGQFLCPGGIVGLQQVRRQIGGARSGWR